MTHRALIATLAVCAVVALTAVSSAVLVRADHSTSLLGLLAIDANVAGNAATALGPLDGCARVEPGAEIKIDYVVDPIPQDRPMIGFEAQIQYNAELLEVVAADYDLMLAAAGTYAPFAGLTDELPDTDGDFRVSVLDTDSMTEPEANVERGRGVLARLTFRGKAAGVSDVTIGYNPTPQGGNLYPIVLDTQNETVFTDTLANAFIAVGQDCPQDKIAPVIIDLPDTEEEIFVQATLAPGQTAPPTSEATTPPDAGTSTPAPSAGGGTTDLVPCPTTGEEAPTSVPATESPTQAAQTGTPAADTPTPAPGATAAPSPTPDDEPTAEALCTPTTTPIDDIVNVGGESSDTGLIVGAVALLGLGTAAAGGGWYIYRRSQNGAV